jgi:methyl-accepting chemotaxis protein
MNWYRNRNTATKLMIAFSIMAGLMGVLGYKGLSDANTLDCMLEELYSNPMLGAAAVYEVKELIPTIGREVQQALLDPDLTSRQRSQANVQSQFNSLEENLAEAEKSLVTAEGKSSVTKIRRLASDYKSLIGEVLRMAVVREDKAAIEHMLKAKTTGDELTQLCAALAAQKDKLGKQAFDDSEIVYGGARRTLLILLAIAVAAALGFGWFISQLLARPLQEMVEVANQLAEGHLNQQLDYRSKDEVGKLADAFRRMIAGFSEPVREVASTLGKVANRDLTARIQAEFKGDFAAIKSSVNTAVENLCAALQEVQKSVANVAATAEQLSSASEELSSGAQEQASSQEETSSSLTEIAGTVKQNAENAQQAKQLANTSREAAEKGGGVVAAAVSAMSEINAASKRIADIITAIDEIAFQTNLLALNAAVEAARAGEQGRGFAVVASEVRNLAQRSAAAAKEIKGLIQDSVRKVEAGTGLVNQSGGMLNEIVAAVKRVSDIVAEIAAASQEQAQGIEQVSKAMSQMDLVTQNTSAQTEELSATAEELSATAAQLSAMTSRFELGATEVPASAVKPAGAVRPGAKPAKGPTSRPHNAGLSQLARAAARPEEAGSFIEF